MDLIGARRCRAAELRAVIVDLEPILKVLLRIHVGCLRADDLLVVGEEHGLYKVGRGVESGADPQGRRARGVDDAARSAGGAEGLRTMEGPLPDS